MDYSAWSINRTLSALNFNSQNLQVSIHSRRWPFYRRKENDYSILTRGETAERIPFLAEEGDL